MCGRYAINASGQQLADTFELTAPVELQRRFNVAPGQVAPVVRAERDGRILDPILWGFEGGSGVRRTVLNARVETAAERPGFRDALAHRRCLVPATGFYEWRRRTGGSEPYHLQVVGSPIFAMAGLWNRWPQPSGEPRPSFVVLTTAPNELVAQVHDRMPMILDRDAWEAWLGPDPVAAAELAHLATPIAAKRMSMYPVSHRVNSIRWDDPMCIARVPESPEQLGLF